MTSRAYASVIRPLLPEEGEGWMVEFPDLPGCVATGDTPEEAVRESEDALVSWIRTAEEFGDPVPEPGHHFSGQWRLRVPRSLHAALAYRARTEGVSLNALVNTLLARSIGHGHVRDRSHP